MKLTRPFRRTAMAWLQFILIINFAAVAVQVHGNPPYSHGHPAFVGQRGHPPYLGLQLAQIPQHEFAGIDLFLDALVQFATWCLAIGLGLPLLKLELWQNIFSAAFA